MSKAFKQSNNQGSTAAVPNSPATLNMHPYPQILSENQLIKQSQYSQMAKISEAISRKKNQGRPKGQTHKFTSINERSPAPLLNTHSSITTDRYYQGASTQYTSRAINDHKKMKQNSDGLNNQQFLVSSIRNFMNEHSPPPPKLTSSKKVALRISKRDKENSDVLANCGVPGKQIQNYAQFASEMLSSKYQGKNNRCSKKNFQKSSCQGSPIPFSGSVDDGSPVPKCTQFRPVMEVKCDSKFFKQPMLSVKNQPFNKTKDSLLKQMSSTLMNTKRRKSGPQTKRAGSPPPPGINSSPTNTIGSKLSSSCVKVLQKKQFTMKKPPNKQQQLLNMNKTLLTYQQNLNNMQLTKVLAIGGSPVNKEKNPLTEGINLVKRPSAGEKRQGLLERSNERSRQQKRQTLKSQNNKNAPQSNEPSSSPTLKRRPKPAHTIFASQQQQQVYHQRKTSKNSHHSKSQDQPSLNCNTSRKTSLTKNSVSKKFSSISQQDNKHLISQILRNLKSDMKKLNFGKEGISQDCRLPLFQSSSSPTNTMNTQGGQSTATNTNRMLHHPDFTQSRFFQNFMNQQLSSNNPIYTHREEQQPDEQVSSKFINRDERLESALFGAQKVDSKKSLSHRSSIKDDNFKKIKTDKRNQEQLLVESRRFISNFLKTLQSRKVDELREINDRFEQEILQSGSGKTKQQKKLEILTKLITNDERTAPSTHLVNTVARNSYRAAGQHNSIETQTANALDLLSDIVTPRQNQDQIIQDTPERPIMNSFIDNRDLERQVEAKLHYLQFQKVFCNQPGQSDRQSNLSSYNSEHEVSGITNFSMEIDMLNKLHIQKNYSNHLSQLPVLCQQIVPDPSIPLYQEHINENVISFVPDMRHKIEFKDPVTKQNNLRPINLKTMPQCLIELQNKQIDMFSGRLDSAAFDNQTTLRYEQLQPHLNNDYYPKNNQYILNYQKSIGDINGHEYFPNRIITPAIIKDYEDDEMPEIVNITDSDMLIANNEYMQSLRQPDGFQADHQFLHYVSSLPSQSHILSGRSRNDCPRDEEMIQILGRDCFEELESIKEDSYRYFEKAPIKQQLQNQDMLCFSRDCGNPFSSSHLTTPAAGDQSKIMQRRLFENLRSLSQSHITIESIPLDQSMIRDRVKLPSNESLEFKPRLRSIDRQMKPALFEQFVQNYENDMPINLEYFDFDNQFNEQRRLGGMCKSLLQPSTDQQRIEMNQSESFTNFQIESDSNDYY